MIPVGKLHRENGSPGVSLYRPFRHAQSALKRLGSFGTPAFVRQFFIRRIYCKLIKNYCLTKTKTFRRKGLSTYSIISVLGHFASTFSQFSDFFPTCRGQYGGSVSFRMRLCRRPAISRDSPSGRLTVAHVSIIHS